MDVKQRLQNLLTLRDLSQGWLAHRAGISRSNITQWLREEGRDIGFTSAIAIARALDAERPALLAQAAALADELAAIERAIARLVDAIEQSGDSAALAARLAQRESERAALQLRLAELAARLAGPPASAVSLAELRAALTAAPLDARRAALRSLLARVEVDADTARVVYRLPFGREMLSSPLGALIIDLPRTWRHAKQG